MEDTNRLIKIDAKGTWLEGVNRIIASPNYDERPHGTTIDLLVIHSISLPPGEFGGGYIDQLFTNTLVPDHPYFVNLASLKVSAHLLIDRIGVLTQYVPFSARAWHAGISEFAGRQNCNDYSIGIELEGSDDQEFTAAQYTILSKTVCAIRKKWVKITKDRIVGHCHIATDRKTDPGPTFNWKKLYISL